MPNTKPVYCPTANYRAPYCRLQLKKKTVNEQHMNNKFVITSVSLQS